MDSKGLGHSALSRSIPTELVARLEVAEAGSRELDWLIHSSVAAPYWLGCEWNEFGYVDVDGHPPHPDQITVFKNGRSFYTDMPGYTTSVTAALELAATLLPRWGMDVGLPARLGEHGGRPWADCWPPVEDGEPRSFRLGGPRPTPFHSNAETPALALCIAILKATTASSVGTEAQPKCAQPDNLGEGGE